MGSQRLGNTFGYARARTTTRAAASATTSTSTSAAWSPAPGPASTTSASPRRTSSPHQLDACGFGVLAYIGSSSNPTAYTEGCATSQLGNGNCDWDCVALYGNDAVVTSWDSTGTKPLTWGASDCTTVTQTSNRVVQAVSSTMPFAESFTYTNGSGGTSNTSFTGATCTGTTAECGGNSTSTVWFEDPNYNTANSAGYCPQSWVGDGYCDECAMFLYGGDGNDCAPGHVQWCGGIVTANQPYAAAGIPEVASVPDGTPCTKSSQCPGMTACSGGYCTKCTNNTYDAAGSCNGQGSVYNWTNGACNTTSGICNLASSVYPSSGNNSIYNEGSSSTGGPGTLGWDSMAGVSGDGVCEQSECGISQLHLGTAALVTPTSCTSSSQCPGMESCSHGVCSACNNSTNNASGSCNSTTYGWVGLVCNTTNGLCYTGTAQCAQNSDCVVGSCVNGGCTTLSGTASDCQYSYTSAGGARACATTADCTGDSCQFVGGTCSDTGLPCTTTAACDAGATCTNAGNQGTCLLSGGSCSSDASCPGPSGATSVCGGGGYCTCTTSADCEGGATCNGESGGSPNGTCSASVTSSLCR